MHTSATTYHRITFDNVTDYSNLLALATVLSLEATDHPDVFDFVLDEGNSMTADEAIREIYMAHYPTDEMAEDRPQAEMITALRKKAAQVGYTPMSLLFTTEPREHLIEIDIQEEELFDLIQIVADGFTVDSVITQWAMFSNKNVYGANAGGSRLLTKHFRHHGDESAELLNAATVEYRSAVDEEEMGRMYVEHFVEPLWHASNIRTPNVRRGALKEVLRRVASNLTEDEVAEVLSQPVID